MKKTIIVGTVTTLLVACTAQEAKNAENFVTDITDAICTPLEDQTSNVYVDFICSLAEGVEGVVTALTDGTQATATMAKTQLTIRVPKANAATFAAQHTSAAVTARKAARGK
jgi:type IV pilus biogenesis protein CpaD/CtpE